MAWLEPKTDWGAADGVRDLDMNRIEGNILDLHSRNAHDNITVYVTTSGNDSTGDGSQGRPFATITKALSVLPHNINGKDVTINVGAGTYSDAVIVKGFFGGVVTITGSSYNAQVNITSLTVNNSTVNVTGMRLSVTASTGVIVTNRGNLISDSNVTCAGTTTTTGLRVTNCSNASVFGTITVAGAAYAVEAINNSNVYIATIAGTGSYGAYSISGSRISYDFMTIIASSRTVYTGSGGRVYTGSQGTTPGGGVASAELEE